MRSLPKVVGMMSCACLLCFGLSSTAALASDDNMQLGPAGERIGGQAGHKAEKEKLQGVSLLGCSDSHSLYKLSRVDM